MPQLGNYLKASSSHYLQRFQKKSFSFNIVEAETPDDIGCWRRVYIESVREAYNEMFQNSRFVKISNSNKLAYIIPLMMSSDTFKNILPDVF